MGNTFSLLMFQGFPFAILRDFTGNTVGQDAMTGWSCIHVFLTYVVHPPQSGF